MRKLTGNSLLNNKTSIGGCRADFADTLLSPPTFLQFCPQETGDIWQIWVPASQVAGRLEIQLWYPEGTLLNEDRQNKGYRFSLALSHRGNSLESLTTHDDKTLAIENVPQSETGHPLPPVYKDVTSK